MTIIWCMVPKILRATDRIFCHFGLIFALFSLLQHQQPETSKFCQKMTKKSLFCHFGLFFALIPPNNQENQIFEKMKKMPWDIIILHTCTINENYKMYGSWDMQHGRQNFFSFWTIFSPFYPYNNPEIIIVFTPEEDLWKYLTAILDVCRSLGCTSIWWLYVTKSSNLDVSLDPRSSYVNDAMILFFKMAIIYTKLLTGLPT